MRKKISIFVLIIVALVIIIAVTLWKKNSKDSSIIKKEVVTTASIEPTETIVSEPTYKEIDFGKSFDSMKGCAVICDSENNTYYEFNKEQCLKQVTPCSTFKIVSTLMGLHSGVLKDKNTKLGYDNQTYPIEQWNKDVTLEEAFQSSCVWYYRKLIDAIGKDEVKQEIEAVDYGNNDISEWDGSGANPIPNLNGFWLGSSLKISPQEQVDVVKKIFEGKSIYSAEEIETLQSIMLYDSVNGYEVYGKTGTGNDNRGWYTGLMEKNDRRYYFAVYLEDKDAEKQIGGSDARSILLDICENEMFVGE